MRTIALLLLVASAGTCQQSAGTTPAPTPTPDARAPIVPQGVMTCDLASGTDGSVVLLCDVQPRFVRQVAGTLGCVPAEPLAGDVATPMACAVGDPYASQIRAILAGAPAKKK